MIFSLYKKLFIIIFLVLISVPYVLHPSQDLPHPVGHDEAAYHLNAKDTVLFGISSIKNDRLACLLFPPHFLAGVIFFSIFGPSLFSMRIFYIILNIISNALFFELIRKSRGLFISVITTISFVFYAPRLAIGKSAMAESLTLPLLLILAWCFISVFRSVRIYFWIGVLGMLIVCTKLDNLFVLIFLTGFVIFECVREWKRNNILRIKKIVKYYFLGLFFVGSIWLGFLLWMGWENVACHFLYVFRANLNFDSYQPGENFSPFTFMLLIHNILRLYKEHFGFLIVTVICIIPSLFIIISKKKERLSPLTLAIFFFSFLLISKLMISTLLFERRVVVCYPLAFLLIAQTSSFFTNNKPNRVNWTKSFVAKEGILLKNGLVVSCLMFLIYLVYLPNNIKISFDTIFSPKYMLIEESRCISSILNKRFKAIFLDGCFSYISLQIPMKFIDVPPDLTANEFISVESNLPFVRKLLLEDNEIRYIFMRENNVEAKKMIEQEFKAVLMASNVRGYRVGLLYYIPPRQQLIGGA